MLDTVKLTPSIGSEVRIDAKALVEGTHATEIRDLLIARGVVAIRGAELNDEQLAAFTATIGEVRRGALHEEEGMLKVVHIPGSFFWHVDGTYTRMPPFATVLAPRVVAPKGGETEFANMYAAFDDLPADEQKYLSTLEVVHTMKAAHNYAVPEPTIERFQSWQGHRSTRPLVWHHKSGRRSLVIGATASHIVGMHFAESHDLLQRLTIHATQDKYVYRHSWKMGDVVIWDNTGTMHRVRPFDPESGRRLHRFAVEGIEPLATESQLSAA
ncbi:3-(4-hydroxyphenyl)acrylonitrile synthase [Novosphingobium sp. CF614]|uniref:TauD/TfdA dioxygenase family protein n=1 Tax=Novosphingobium sp. CF614 TaxID=1884364 RepID=UPI0008EDCE45|nr:TauD/TfdA family dioxygenase [Novosphingobium sp. CF614]SFF82923.1 3-(4-hydroxyphenyl)acrylonitrile synthase [Novosphingobium sp. CF614]